MSSEVDSWLEAFEAAFIELRQQIRTKRTQLRVEAIRGDKFQAAKHAQSVIQLMRELEHALKNSTSEQTTQGS